MFLDFRSPILTSEQVGESSNKSSNSKQITKTLFKLYEIPLDKQKKKKKSQQILKGKASYQNKIIKNDKENK